MLCTVRLSRRLYPEAVGHGLDAIVARHGLQDAFDADPAARAGRHSALGDARVLWRFVQRLYREKGVPDIDAAVKRLLKIPSLPPQLAPDALENLPEGPGVYRFYGVNDLPLYIGKSVNLRERMRSHFSSDYRSANDMRISGEIRRIEVEETAGELGALLREARAREGAAAAAQLPPAPQGERACFVRMEDLARAARGRCQQGHRLERARSRAPSRLYGPFAAQAQRARSCSRSSPREHGLCWRQLGWEKRGGPCFARQVRKCRGACIGEETPAACTACAWSRRSAP